MLGNENHLARVNHDHTYAKNAAKIKKSAGKKLFNKGVDPSACGISLNKRVESNQCQNLQKVLEPQNVNKYKIKVFRLNVGGVKI